MYLFTVKHLHLLQLTTYVNRLQFQVYKSRKDLKPARIMYYDSQTDANLDFFWLFLFLFFKLFLHFSLFFSSF